MRIDVALHPLKLDGNLPFLLLAGCMFFFKELFYLHTPDCHGLVGVDTEQPHPFLISFAY